MINDKSKDEYRHRHATKSSDGCVSSPAEEPLCGNKQQYYTAVDEPENPDRNRAYKPERLEDPEGKKPVGPVYAKYGPVPDRDDSPYVSDAVSVHARKDPIGSDDGSDKIHTIIYKSRKLQKGVNDIDEVEIYQSFPLIYLKMITKPY